MMGGFLQHGLRYCWLLGASLLLIDGVFFVTQYEWILSTTEWWYVQLPFFANVAFSSFSWLLACAWWLVPGAGAWRLVAGGVAGGWVSKMLRSGR